MRYKRSHLSVIFFSFLMAVNVLCPAVSFSQDTPEAITIGKKLKFYSEVLKEERLLLLYLPSGYDQLEESYPVLYLLDGGFNFHYTTGTVKFLARNSRIPDMIIVAIRNTKRTRDLTPPTQADSQEASSSSGGADNFLAFLKDELIPHIDQTYRTQPYRLLVGHSFGGLFAVHALVKQPDVFNSYLAISPSLWWNEQALVEEVKTFLKNNPDLMGDLYMTVGNEGGTMLGAALKLSGVLEEEAPKSFRWHFEPMEQETHSSIPHRSTYDGLAKIFEGWYIHEPILYYDQGGLAALDKNYEKVSKRMGYTISTPNFLVIQIGNALLEQERAEEAVDVFEQAIKDKPTNARAYKRLGDAYKKLEIIELAKKYYLKSFDLNPGYENAKKMLTELGVDVSALTPDVTISHEILAKYVGEYQAPNYVLEIIIEDEKLYGKEQGQKFEFHPMSETKFYLTGSNFQITFNQNAAGVVESMTIHRGGEAREAKRIK